MTNTTKIANDKPINTGKLLVITSLLVTACESNTKMGTPEQRTYCRSQAIATSFGSSNVEKRYEDCIRQMANPEESKDTTASPQIVTKSLDASKAYTNCIFHQQEVRLAYQRQHALGGRIPSFERDFGKEHPRTVAARSEYQNAVDNLAKLIPEAFRQGLPLIPDAGKKFSLCKRSEFGLP